MRGVWRMKKLLGFKSEDGFGMDDVKNVDETSLVLEPD